MNAAGEHGVTEAAEVPITTWQGPVEVQRSARIPVSAFAEQLLSEPEHEPEGILHLYLGHHSNQQAFCSASEGLLLLFSSPHTITSGQQMVA